MADFHPRYGGVSTDVSSGGIWGTVVGLGTRPLTPEQRLQAFLRHSRLVMKLQTTPFARC